MAKKYLELVWTSQPLGTHPVSTTNPDSTTGTQHLAVGEVLLSLEFPEGSLEKIVRREVTQIKQQDAQGRFVGNANVISWVFYGFLIGSKWIWRPVPFCCGYIRMHPTFMQRTNMIEKCKTQLTHLALNRDSLSLRTLVFATWVHFTLRNADDLLLALSPQDESSLGLVWPRGLMRLFMRLKRSCQSWKIGCRLPNAKELESYVALHNGHRDSVANARPTQPCDCLMLPIAGKTKKWCEPRPKKRSGTVPRFSWASNLHIAGHHLVLWRLLCLPNLAMSMFQTLRHMLQENVLLFYPISRWMIKKHPCFPSISVERQEQLTR